MRNSAMFALVIPDKAPDLFKRDQFILSFETSDLSKHDGVHTHVIIIIKSIY